MTAYYVPARFGCLERDSFQLQGSTRILVTASDVPRRQSKSGDEYAPLAATFTINPTAAQFEAFTQWFRYDLAGGALPFLIDLWLWNVSQRVRARFQGSYNAKQTDPDRWQLSGVFEIERQSVLATEPDLPALRP